MRRDETQKALEQLPGDSVREKRKRVRNHIPLRTGYTEPRGGLVTARLETEPGPAAKAVVVRWQNRLAPSRRSKVLIWTLSVTRSGPDHPGMNRYLLDTNVISEYSRARPPEARIKTWVDAQDEDALYLSVLTLGEIRKRTTLLPRGNKRDQLQKWLETELSARFGNRLLSINREIAQLWGAMAGQAQLRGITLAVIDGLVAATATHHDGAIVTRSVLDFSVRGISAVNPWKAI